MKGGVDKVNRMLRSRAHFLVIATLFLLVAFGVDYLVGDNNQNDPQSVEFGVKTTSPLGEEGGFALPASGTTCFTGDTLVATPSGNVPIKNLEVGDSIYSYADGDLIVTRVTELFVHDGIRYPKGDFDASPLLRIVLEDGTAMRVTANHLVYSPKDEVWKEIGTFSAGDTLVHIDGGTVRITSMEVLEEKPVVYNIHTDDESHNYFADGVLVHNFKYPYQYEYEYEYQYQYEYEYQYQYEYEYQYQYQYQTPAYGYQTPAYGYQTPAYGYQTPAYGYQTPSYGYQYQYQTPAYGYQTPSYGYQTPIATPECSDGINNDGDSFIDYPDDPGCTGPSDDSEEEALLEIDAPSLVSQGAQVEVSWSATGVQQDSCEVTGDNGDGPWSGESGTQTTSPLSGETRYTLMCTNLDGNDVITDTVIRVGTIREE